MEGFFPGFYMLLKTLQHFHHIRLEPFPAFFFQFFRNTVHSLCHSSGDAGQGITVSAQRDRRPNNIFEASPLKECRNGLGDCTLAADIKTIGWPDLITGFFQRIDNLCVRPVAPSLFVVRL